MTEIRVPYGDGWQEAVVPDGINVQVIDPVCEPAGTPVETLIQEALDHPIGTPALEEMVSSADRVAVIVNDHTRPGPNAQIVDALIRRLNGAGVPDGNICFVIATGSHRASTAEELDKILGEQYRRRIRIHNHDCRTGNVLIGTTQAGMPVWIDREVAESSFIITTGLINPHATAGFSGGRKSIVPGVAGIETLHIHHSLPIRPFDPSMGFFEENPFHQAALEAAKMVRVRFIINVVQDTHKQNIACVAGDLEKAHMAGVALCRKANTVKVDSLADVVIVSPGGAPRDKDLYQAQKALSVGEVFAKKGGQCTFILCARADEGIGEGLFRSWLEEAENPQEVIDRFRTEGFNVGNNKAFMYARAMQKGRVLIVSDQVDRADLQKMMLDGVPTLQEAVDLVCKCKQPEHVIVLPRAVNIIPEI